MGAYVYRVTEHRVTCEDGIIANVAVFSHKPSLWGPNRLSNETEIGLLHSRELRRRGFIGERVVLGHDDANFNPDPSRYIKVGPYWVSRDATVYRNPRHWASFVDDTSLGVEGRLPVAKGARPSHAFIPQE